MLEKLKRCRALRTGESIRLCSKPVADLAYYAENSWAEVDNNIAGNALRLMSLGRKNWLFFGSDHGGKWGALLYGLIDSCRLNGIDSEHSCATR